jgi:acetyl-CoA carboxylase biotin carboxyl carrier protein
MGDFGLIEIKSPLDGTFYGSPKRGAPPFVTVGGRVTTGQVVCMIAAKMVMNDIESDVAGLVKEIAAHDRQPVEFGQVLFRVDPHG